MGRKYEPLPFLNHFSWDNPPPPLLSTDFNLGVTPSRDASSVHRFKIAPLNGTPCTYSLSIEGSANLFVVSVHTSHVCPAHNIIILLCPSYRYKSIESPNGVFSFFAPLPRPSARPSVHAAASYFQRALRRRFVSTLTSSYENVQRTHHIFLIVSAIRQISYPVFVRNGMIHYYYYYYFRIVVVVVEIGRLSVKT